MRPSYRWLLLAIVLVIPATARAQIYVGYYDPWGLHGAAAVIAAQGQYAKDIMTAAKIREEARQAQVETRRKKDELYLWEREHMPTTEDERQFKIKEAEKRYAYMPPLNEIWSGDALNGLLRGLFKVDSGRLLSDTTPIDPDYLPRLNVNTGFNTANTGLIRGFQQGKGLPWPRVMQREQFVSARERTENDLKTIIQSVQQNKPAADQFNSLERDITQMKKDVVQLQKDGVIDHRLAIDSYGFFGEMANVLMALEKRNAAEILNKFVAQGKTAGELVHYMNGSGLRFTVMTP
ncbi:MAG: hypothetical protein ACJ8F7_15390, partial [Gemmataceae bacterium]